MAYEQKKIMLHTPIWVRTNELKMGKFTQSPILQTNSFKKNKYIRTTVGRILINRTISKNLYL